MTEVVVESGHRLLRAAAENNVRTWKFASHTPGRLHVTFRYKMASEGTAVTFPESTSIVQIETTPQLITDVPCGLSTLDIGRWKTQLNSSSGVTSQVLELSSPCAESLEGTARGRKGRKEKIDFGYYEDPFLAFTMNIHQPDGRTIRTFFVGKRSNTKLLGALLTMQETRASGLASEWLRLLAPGSANLSSSV